MRRLIGLIIITVACPAEDVLSQDVKDLFSALAAHYREHPPAFPAHWSSLRSKTVSQEHGVDIQIRYVEGQAVVIDSSLGGWSGHDGSFHRAYGSGETALSETRILKTRLDRDSEDGYLVDFSLGPSMDPHFIVHRVDEDSTIFVGKLFCVNLFIPGDGAIYTAGHINNMFDIRRRFTVENDHLIQTPQPFYDVGLKTVTTGSLVLFSDQQRETVLDTLPPETPITVLLNKGDLYLIRTPFGLTGWAVVEHAYDTPIRHLIFRGD